MDEDAWKDEEEETPNLEPIPEAKQDEEIILGVFSKANSKPTIEVSQYDGRLETDTLLDWISEMEKYFEYEGTLDNKKAKIIVTKLKGHDLLW